MVNINFLLYSPPIDIAHDISNKDAANKRFDRFRIPADKHHQKRSEAAARMLDVDRNQMMCVEYYGFHARQTSFKTPNDAIIFV